MKKKYLICCWLVSLIFFSGCQFRVRNEVREAFRGAEGLISSSQAFVEKTGQFFSSKFKIDFFRSKLKIPYDLEKDPPKVKNLDLWRGLHGHFAVVASPNMPVYPSPRRTKKIFKHLSLSQRVRPVVLSPGDDEDMKIQPWRWVFVTSQDGKHPIGWINFYGLALPSYFSSVRDWPWSEIRFCKDGYCAHYQVNDRGWFLNNWRSKGKGIHLEGKAKGRFERYQTLVWAKNDSVEDPWVDLFLIDQDSQLKMETQFKDMTVKTEAVN